MAGMVALTGGCVGLGSDDTGEGTPTAETPQEPTATTRIVEDFETGGLSAYDGDTDGFAIEREETYNGSAALRGDNPGSESFDIWDSDRESAPTAGERFRFNLNLGETGSNGGAARLYFAVQDTDEWVAVGIDGGSDVGGMALNVSNEVRATADFDVPYGEWLEIEVEWGLDGVVVARAYRPDAPESVLGAAAIANVPDEGGGIGWKMLDAPGEQRWVDYLRVVGDV